MGDKGLQIKHEGMNIRQILLTRVFLDFLVFMRQMSSHSLTNMINYNLKTHKKFDRKTSFNFVVSQLLVLLSDDPEIIKGIFNLRSTKWIFKIY